MNNCYELIVTREAGTRKCLLTGHLAGAQIARVVTLDPQMMVDYLDAVFPRMIVKWRLSPPVVATTNGWHPQSLTQTQLRDLVALGL